MQEAETLHHFAGQDNVDKVQELLASGADVHALDGDGATPLHFAADRGAAAAAECLLAGGADVSARDGGGMTALHYAACSGHEEVRAHGACDSGVPVSRHASHCRWFRITQSAYQHRVLYNASHR